MTVSPANGRRPMGWSELKKCETLFEELVAGISGEVTADAVRRALHLKMARAFLAEKEAFVAMVFKSENVESAIFRGELVFKGRRSCHL